MTQSGSYQSIYGDEYEAKIHLDPYNSRARLLEYQGSAEKIIEVMKQICLEHHWGKLVCAVYPHDRSIFSDRGFLSEGQISGFFRGKSADCFSYFFDQTRAESNYISKEDDILSQCAKSTQKSDIPEDSDTELRTALKEDAPQIASLFREVFPFYPTPMGKPEYIQKMMNQDVLFKVIKVDGILASVASADMNRNLLHAEITDCATQITFRGKGYLNQLVFSLEKELRSLGYLTAFSLSRARSFGMNKVLSNRGYEYSGRHINNCRIMNEFEDMNIWVKRLQN